MTNKLFAICLLVGLTCAYCEYYWMRHGYRSLALVASKCPKPSMGSVRPVVHVSNQTTIDSILTWFWNIFATNKDKPIVPIVCETFEIHTDPRSTFLLIKTLCLVGLTCKLISSLRTVPTLIRARHATLNESHLMATMPKGDGLVQQSKILETSSNGKISLLTSTTTIDKRTLPVR